MEPLKFLAAISEMSRAPREYTSDVTLRSGKSSAQAVKHSVELIAPALLSS